MLCEPNVLCCLSVLSGSVLVVLSAVRGDKGRVVSPTSSCFLSSVWKSSLHHSCTPASKHCVRTRNITTNAHVKQLVFVVGSRKLTTHNLLIFVVFWCLCDKCMSLCVFRSLRQTEQWRCLVSELIAVCYRMSDVVSPVVQSSSPEGLIPMDTDSGNLIS